METYSFSSYFSMRDGCLHCEETSVTDVHRILQDDFPGRDSPFFVYSQNQIVENILAYKQPLLSLSNQCILGYAVKANSNLSILKLIRQHCDTAVVVSGNELKLALAAGFLPENIVYNGCGKTLREIDHAVSVGCLLNIDSLFDVAHIGKIAKGRGVTVRVLIRINPDIEVTAHPYISTALAQCKFGIGIKEIDEVLRYLQDQPKLRLVGFHCHLGSTIERTDVYRKTVSSVLQVVETVRSMGLTDIQYINIGGGLGIDYKRHAKRTSPFIKPAFLDIVFRSLQDGKAETDIIAENILEAFENQHKMTPEEVSEIIRSNLQQYPHLIEEFEKQLEPELSHQCPTPSDLVASVKDLVEGKNISLILEPGRSVVGNAGVLVMHVIGCKKNGHKRFLITDGSMTEVIRPSLYSAYHHIELAESSTLACGKAVYDIVGPVCESGDFLGKDRLLSVPHEGCSVTMFDVGAYGSVMSSNYNSRLRPVEIIVSGRKWAVIRKPETFGELINPQLLTITSEDKKEEKVKEKQSIEGKHAS
ncbi:probable diaminopimelate decarboxylase, chloroplastic [Lingula anatina]|uniref:Probable diaminopimelate decarboxylase, chloroplastic n=1 Tax=Lingula anatina TaxID=7574 RepID=A0A2R2MKH8_LINAN|nr:probable diaminopimelate decarboxylase, chloroplastic [Lingula anatina]|eukprot:XP_023930703.1 probable diaminopimelate decarboxylase, chloroplastic [Lingula anatina]